MSNSGGKGDEKISINIILSIDPGTAKSGLAVVDSGKNILERRVVPTKDLENELRACIFSKKPDIILLGDGTFSKKMKPLVEKVAGDLPVKTINEKHSTERARVRFFKENPPRGLWRLIPTTLQVPKVPVDDYAAVVLAEDFIDLNLR